MSSHMTHICSHLFGKWPQAYFIFSNSLMFSQYIFEAYFFKLQRNETSRNAQLLVKDNIAPPLFYFPYCIWKHGEKSVNVALSVSTRESFNSGLTHLLRTTSKYVFLTTVVFMLTNIPFALCNGLNYRNSCICWK